MRQKCLFFFVLMCVFVGLSGCDRGGKSRSGNSDSTPFTMKLETAADYEGISFYVKGDGDIYSGINIDWGDGDSETIYGEIGHVVEHTYTTAGAHTVSITGFNQMAFFNKDVSGGFNFLESCGEKLREVKSWGGVEWDSTEFMFGGCSNLTTLPSEAPDLSNVVDMSGMFYGATNFNQDISGWDVSNVEDMSYMFYRATNFNQDIGGWNVSNVVNMSGMFYGATNFNQPLNDWGEHLDNVVGMSWMFSSATNFNQDISGWDVSNVKDMSWMFWGAKKFARSIYNWQPHEGIKLDNFIHKESAYQIQHGLPAFCQNNTKDNSNESVCLSDDIYKPEESETAQSSVSVGND